MSKQLQNPSRDTVFTNLFSSLDEEEAEIGTAYLTSCAQGANRNVQAKDVFPHSLLKEEYRDMTVGALFKVYLRGRQNVSVAQELVMQKSLRVVQ